MTDNVLITGCCGGIGSAVVDKFIHIYDDNDQPYYTVYGIDTKSIDDNIEINGSVDNLHYYQINVRETSSLHSLKRLLTEYNSNSFQYIINCAGCQTEYNPKDACMQGEIQNYDIDTNLTGLINVCEYFAYQPKIKSVLNLASSSGHTGSEFPRYAASKGGVLSYTKALAMDLSKYGATVNSISFGGVTDAFNESVMQGEKWDRIMNVTPLKKWCTVEEAAQWIYFLTVINRSMTGQDIVIDNGEMINSNFVW